MPRLACCIASKSRSHVEIAMRPTKHLAGWSKTTFLLMSAVCLLLLLTGLVMFLLPASDLMDMSAGQAALRHGAGVVHGVCTWFFCFMCGRAVWPHVRVMWHKRGHSYTWALGLINLIFLAGIALTGLFLLYGNPDLHDQASPLHFWMGVWSPFILVFHTWRRFVPSKLALRG
jgi:hypothetical protein